MGQTFTLEYELHKVVQLTKNDSEHKTPKKEKIYYLYKKCGKQYTSETISEVKIVVTNVGFQFNTMDKKGFFK